MRNVFLSKLLLFVAVVSSLGVSEAALAGNVHSCKTTFKKTKTNQSIKLERCVIEISEGKVGDVVEVKNEYNYIVATGKVLRRQGRYVLVILNKIVKDVKTGYPVIVRNNDNINYWTAASPPL